jgi:hypothetical protein
MDEEIKFLQTPSVDNFIKSPNKFKNGSDNHRYEDDSSMKMELIALITASVAMIGCASAVMPVGFYGGVADQKWESKLCVQNYDTGESFTEVYSDAEHLEMSTKVRTSNSEEGGGIEASINSNVIGRAHISWRSVDPQADSHGRHAEWGRSVEDLVGVFNIEKFVLLWSNSTCGEISTDWMPCV